jgi:hypothetical protein
MRIGDSNVREVNIGGNSVLSVYHGLDLVWNRDGFSSTWDTTNTSAGSSSATQIKLPLVATGTYNFVVKWGDGTSDVITSHDQAEVTHTYSSSGVYSLIIFGLIDGWSFNNSGDRLKLLTVDRWGDLIVSSGGFYGCSNLTLTSVIDVLKLENVTDVSYLFASCTSITTINRSTEWTTTNITNMTSMFHGATNFNSDLRYWDVQNVTNMHSMFRDAVEYNLIVSGWVVNNVTDFRFMFAGASSFNQGLNGWNVTNAVYMGSMFSGATAFNQPIHNWNIINVIDFVDFMRFKTSSDYSESNLNDIYNTWSTLSVQPNIVIHFGSIRYGSSGSSGRDVLTDPPNNWDITDGGPNVSLPNSPQNLRVSSVTYKSLVLEWDSVQFANSYTVEYKETTSGTWIVKNSSTVALSEPFSNLLSDTSYDFRVAANNLAGSSWSNIFTTSTNPVPVFYRVNVGGDVVTATDGNMNWGADTDINPSPYLVNNGGSNIVSTNVTTYTGAIPTTTPLAIFNEERRDEAAGANVTYQFPLSSGDYIVRYYGVGPFGKLGKVGGAVFDITLEGVVNSEFNDIDLVVLAGNKTGHMISSSVTCSDGNLNITFPIVNGGSLISGIEIIGG